MPVIESSYTEVPFYCLNGHVETVIPHLFRRVKFTYERERFELPDDDFVDLDWKRRRGVEELIILCHGLEGSTHSHYMKGMAKYAFAKGLDVLALNFRSCSGEPNRQFRLYHHGETEDLRTVIQYVLREHSYDRISLIGFSLGGNVIAKYLFEEGEGLTSEIKGGVAISTPGHLASSSSLLDQWQNFLYTRRFRRSIRRKILAKKELIPEDLEVGRLTHLKKWSEFDDYFTSAMYDFSGAEEYYTQGSANNYLEGIRVPFLIINALNDPFLDVQSYPYRVASTLENVYLETPEHGGHVGFLQKGGKGPYYEERAIEFLDSKW